MENDIKNTEEQFHELEMITDEIEAIYNYSSRSTFNINVLYVMVQELKITMDGYAKIYLKNEKEKKKDEQL